MKKLLIIGALLGISSLSTAQLSSKPKEVTLGYKGHSAIFPGGDIGLRVHANSWTKERAKGEATVIRNRSFFIHPQVAFYGRRKKYNSIFFNTELGIRGQKEGRKVYTAYSVGLGYVGRFEVMSLVVDFSGEITQMNRERRDYFMPNLNFELGRNFGNRISFFSKVSYGLKLSGSHARSGNLYLGLGFTYKLSGSEQ